MAGLLQFCCCVPDERVCIFDLSIYITTLYSQCVVYLLDYIYMIFER